MSKKILVTGAGGFIGHHLVNRLIEDGNEVRGADIKYPEFESTKSNDFRLLDLRDFNNCLEATKDIDEVYNLAADMGGIGFITSNHAEITRNNVLINVNMLHASRENKVKRFAFSSSACIYPQFLQDSPDVTPLKEEDAYPADPEPGYGLEKLFSEELCKYYLNDFELETRIARFHNVYGPVGTYDGGREKVPAALCRKIANANLEDEIEVWGDGEQTRSFMYVDDCVEGLIRIMDSECKEPLNLGTDRLVTINELVDIIANIANKKISMNHDLTKPQGVRGRNSNNNKLREVLGWEPSIDLEQGLKKTYDWIYEQINNNQ